MPIKIQVQGFGKIEDYELHSTFTVLEIKLRFCNTVGRSVTSVVPFVNHRRLIDSHTLEEAHIPPNTPIKMVDIETAKLIETTIVAEQPMMRKERVANSEMNIPKMMLKPWNDGKPKGGLGIF
jgi:hypothetical protein